MQLIRAKELAKKLAMHESSVYRIVLKDPSFPKPIRLSSRFVAWVESDVDKWLLTR